MLEKNKKVYAIIQARMGAIRLPDKVLLELLPGKTVIDCMIDRVKRAKLVDVIIIATTENPKDKKLIEHLESINQKYFVGDENDVLDRYYQTAKQYGARPDDIIIRLTADCPVIDPSNIDKLIKIYLDNKYDFVSNTLEPYSWPDGMDVEIFSFGNLEKAWQEAKLPSHREHVTFYFWQNTEKFKIYYDKNERNLSGYRLTLDYKEDYELLKKIYEHFNAQGKNGDFSTQDIINFLDTNPDIRSINSEAKRNAGWQSALAKDKELEIKDNHC